MKNAINGLKIEGVITDIVKGFYKNKKEYYFCDDMTDFVGVSKKGHVAYFVPKAMFPIDLNVVKGTELPILGGIFEGWNTMPDECIVYSDYTKEINGEKMRVFVVANEPDKFIYVKEKYMKYFDEKDGLRYRVQKGKDGKADNLSPVHIYNFNDVYIGLIMPVNINGSR